MDMNGEYRIQAPRDRVWTALNDPDTLGRCLPGCESVEKTEENAFIGRAALSIGPVKARFSGKVQLLDIDPPNSYRLMAEGTGGAAGFAKGGAQVTLSEDGADGTLLSYTAEAQLSGKLAQIGSRLIQGSAKKLADQFFANFADLMNEPADSTTL